jgi:hypothetical protein
MDITMTMISSQPTAPMSTSCVPALARQALIQDRHHNAVTRVNAH